MKSSHFQFALAFLAGWVNRSQFALIEYLQTENQVYRELIGKKRPRFTDDQRRRLAVKAKALGRKALSKLDCMVTPDTLFRWYRNLIAQKYDGSRNRGPRRPRSTEDITTLIVRMAKENTSWGYTRIVGALKNLGITSSRTTVKNILKDHGIEPAPKRGKGMDWSAFINIHLGEIVAADFFTAAVCIDILHFRVRELGQRTGKRGVFGPSRWLHGFYCEIVNTHPAPMNTASPKTYDQRLRNLVYATQDLSIALDLGVPRSTAHGWIRNEPPEVVTLNDFDFNEQQLQYELIRTRKRCKRLMAIVRLLVVFVRTLGIRIDFSRISDGKRKTTLLRVIESAKAIMPLKSVLKIVGVSSSRYYLWDKKQQCDNLDDESSCPKTSPNQLTTKEIFAIKDMATSDEYRHVPTSTLAILAQRIGRVFASAATWHKLIKERGWRRPRKRLHPAKPKIGIRTTKPDERWHINTTIVKLLDGTKAYIHGVIDNHSRRILSFLVTDRFDIESTIRVPLDASQACLLPDIRHTFICDSGIENINYRVDELIRKGVLKRILAYVEIDFSNSLIEAW